MYLSEDAVIPEDSALVFDRVLSNVGGGYNEFVGIFTPPVDGLYFLTVNVLGNGDQQAGTQIMRNDEWLCQTWSASGGGTGACSVCFSFFMEKNDKTKTRAI